MYPPPPPPPLTPSWPISEITGQTSLTLGYHGSWDFFLCISSRPHSLLHIDSFVFLICLSSLLDFVLLTSEGCLLYLLQPFSVVMPNPSRAVAHVWSQGPMSTPTLDSEAETQREQAAFPFTELPRGGARF